MRQGRGLAAMIVARERDHAAILRRSGGIAVLQHVHRAIDAGALAVPDREDAIDLRAGEQVGLLAAPHRRRREILVEAGLEVDVVFLEVPLRAPQRVVVHAERRAAIARDEAAGVESRRRVALLLHHRQAHQRLDAGEIDAALVQAIAILEGVVAEDERDGGIGGAHGEALPGRREQTFMASTIARIGSLWSEFTLCALPSLRRAPWNTQPYCCIAMRAGPWRDAPRSPPTSRGGSGPMSSACMSARASKRRCTPTARWRWTASTRPTTQR